MAKVIAADVLFSSTLPTATQYDSIAASALVRAIDKYTAEDYDGAIREFKRSIAWSPYSETSLKAYEYLANTLSKTGKTDEAIKVSRQAIQAFPSADGMNLALGNLLYGKGQYADALVQYKAAVQKNPSANQNVYSLGQGYLAVGRYAEAETQFKRAIQISPKESGGYYALGQTYRQMGRLDDAQVQLEKAISIKSSFADAHYELGLVYNEKGKTDKANAELAILSKEQSTQLYTELQDKIYQTAKPKFAGAYSSGLDLTLPTKTEVSSLDPALANPGERKSFTVNFVFSKEMDSLSVQNMTNWSITRSTESRTGGLYNWGLSTPTDANVPSGPASVIYDPDTHTAKMTFVITQNSAGDGTIDLSHLVFKFKGADRYGNAMDSTGDEYNRFSKIV
jgi:tetratricopeptide (TPR) repeat protein